MNLGKSDLNYFVDFVFLDLADRPSAKRQLEPMTALWLSRSTAGAGGAKVLLRGSDLRERCFVCISALSEIGETNLGSAAADVAARLGAEYGTRGESVRMGYYQFLEAAQKRGVSLEKLKARWAEHFFGWREFVLSADADTAKGRRKYNFTDSERSCNSSWAAWKPA